MENGRQGRQDRAGLGSGGFSGFSHGTQSEWSHLPPPAAAEAAIHANELVCAAATLAFIHLQKSRIRHERPQGRQAANTLNSTARHGAARHGMASRQGARTTRTYNCNYNYNYTPVGKTQGSAGKRQRDKGGVGRLGN